jgi:uncharacterized membrane protein YfcA
MLIALLIPLSLAIVLFAALLVAKCIKARAKPRLEAVAIGAITNFFDTLGIGSFAPTMAWFKFRNLVPDRLIPPTMLVGHTPAAMAQAVIFLILLGVLVDPVLLVGCGFALLLGGLLGAPLVAGSRVWVVQAVVAVALLIAAVLYALTNLDMMPGGGTAGSLPTHLTVIAIVANFIFGILLNFGIGSYAPTLVMLSLMGMDPRLAFPIMAAGGAITGAGASSRHLLIGQIDLRIAIGIAIGGIPAVLVAALLVRDMPVELLRWLVAAVVLYASAVMFHAALSGRRASREELLAAGETG